MAPKQRRTKAAPEPGGEPQTSAGRGPAAAKAWAPSGALAAAAAAALAAAMLGVRRGRGGNGFAAAPPAGPGPAAPGNRGSGAAGASPREAGPEDVAALHSGRCGEGTTQRPGQVTSPGPSLGRWISVGESAAEDVTEATSDGVQVRAIRREAFGKRVEAQAFELRVHRATLVVSQASRQALNVQMSGVPSLAAGGQVGGLLGTSRHDKAIEKFTPECSASRQQALDSWMDSVEIGESATGSTDA
ncbi:unnamed protein product [Prorocentrum cordatum]|uniref:Uncharacterized protein n=1 Tax=Prorocentrum cordatum TaxID=2364126 RepID=A0ABN9TRV2_9DINO|nr:unnamed protein product [Polarella glacialis]